jgi:formylglycine-generating enzyme required for sulfatase activity
MGKVQDDVMHDWNNTPTQQHVQSFYMDETEVTNFMYLEYLDWLKMCSHLLRKVINIFMKVLHLIL